MWQRDHGCFCDRFVLALHEICEQFSFSFDINGSSSDETEAIFLQDVIAVLHHLRITNTITYVFKAKQNFDGNIKLSNISTVLDLMCFILTVLSGHFIWSF